MSNRERIVRLLDSISDHKFGYVLAFIKGMTVCSDTGEAEDDFFCQRMVQNYIDDPESKDDKGTSLEECKREWGIN